MKKRTDFIVEKRKYILGVFLLVAIFSIFFMSKVNINYDITKYLPQNSETRIGMDLMKKNFKQEEESTLNIMFKNLKEKEKIDIKETLEKIEHVKSVSYEKENNKYNKGKYTLYELIIDKKEDKKEATDVYNKVKEKFEDKNFEMSGTVADRNEPVLPTWIVGLAVLCALIILIIMSNSYLEPFLFMFVILLAVLLNMGTNIVFECVSNITNSISAILQMALSMDYSIMLMNRYNQEKEREKENVKAMKKALFASFRSISSSSITTIVGLLALVFMSFTIGKDLGFVLAKGVLLSLLCIFTCLPGLILLFDKLITKTKKKSFNVKLDKLGNFSYKIRHISIILFILVFASSFLLKGNLGIEYTDQAENEVNNIFKEKNQMALVYKNKYEKLIAKYCKSLEKENKIDEILCYGNTINEKLTYQKLNNKLKELGTDTNIEDNLLKIIYYNYHNKDENKMTFKEFVTFIEEKIINDPEISKNIDENTKKSIEKLKNFTQIENINKKRTINEIASIFDIEESQVKDLFTYYLSKNNQTKLTVSTFTSFMKMDVLSNTKYNENIGKKERESLQFLEKFNNKTKLLSPLTKEEMSNLFGLDTKTVEQLYIYYHSLNDTKTELSINEFANFILEEVITNKEYENVLDKDTINQITLLKTLSTKNIITQEIKGEEIANLFNIQEDLVKKIILLNHLNTESNTNLSLKELILSVENLKQNTNYLDEMNTDQLLALKPFALNEQNNNETEKTKVELSQMFDTLYPNLVDTIYKGLGLADTEKMIPIQFIEKIINNFNQILDENTLNSIKLIYTVMMDSIDVNAKKYTLEEMSNMLNIDKENLNKIYILTDFVNGNIKDEMTPEQFVNFILENSEKENIKNSLTEDMKKQLILAKQIMDSTLKNEVYQAENLATLIGINEEIIKTIYSLYNKNNQKMSPYTFTNFILEHEKDNVLEGKINTVTRNELIRLKNIMNSIMNDRTHSSNELSILLGINKEQLDLLYGLYTLNYIEQTPTLSINEFTTFLVNDVLKNPSYNSNFDEGARNKLQTIKGIINNSIKSTNYTSGEIYMILTNLSKDLEKNLVELVYLYYGAENKYNEKWTLTIEEFVNDLNNTIIKDERLYDFINQEMREKIKDSQKIIKKAKELLVGKNYSRIILNTNFDLEGKETYNFIKKIKKELIKEKKGIYIIGDSAMSYEMDQSFNSELDLITIITMIAIFIVVALSFKSLIIPFILVLIIQTAVYLTMGILSVIGGNVYFIALLIVQSILMGATIDYAIVYTSYYLESRTKLDVKNAIINAYNKSIHTIATSSLILIIVTLIIGNFTSAVASKICKTLSEGTICASLLILLLLPALLGGLDRFIHKKSNQKD